MKSHFQLLGLLIGVLLLACGCSKQAGTESTQVASLSSTATQPQVKVNVKIYDNNRNVVYDDQKSSSMLVLKSGQNYSLHLDAPNGSPSGVTYSLVMTRTSVVNASAQTIALKEGDTNLSVANQGDYAMKILANAPSMMPLTKFYSASVTCANPTFTADSLNAAAISVTAGSGSNLYNVTANGIASAANGQAPYKCAFDPTGSGIIDTSFVDCGSSIANFYSNYVNNRNVSVVVKDACGMVHTASKAVNLPYSVPAMGAGNVFIHGIVSNASGSAIGDKRVDGVHYLATNTGRKIVQPAYNGSQFTITSSMNYNQASSVNFGMSISLQGLKGNVDPASGTGSVDVSSATIKSVSYDTDQAGDALVKVAFKGSSCVLSNQGAKVVFTNGTPCSAGLTGSGKQATVEVWGQYTCTGLSNSGGSISISGSFDGLTTLVDSCSGGGGGGGGIVPINL